MDVYVFTHNRSHNALKSAAGSSGVGEKGKSRKKEREDGGKRKRSALEEIREVNGYMVHVYVSLSVSPSL